MGRGRGLTKVAGEVAPTSATHTCLYIVPEPLSGAIAHITGGLGATGQSHTMSRVNYNNVFKQRKHIVAQEHST